MFDSASSRSSFCFLSLRSSSKESSSLAGKSAPYEHVISLDTWKASILQTCVSDVKWLKLYIEEYPKHWMSLPVVVQEVVDLLERHSLTFWMRMLSSSTATKAITVYFRHSPTFDTGRYILDTSKKYTTSKLTLRPLCWWQKFTNWNVNRDYLCKKEIWHK